MLEVIGLEGAIANIGIECEGARERAGAALYRRSQIIIGVSEERTPVDKGALRASHYVKEPVNTPNGDLEVVMGVGGPSAPYAIHVHENLEAFHKVGQAKFLESAVLEAVPTLAEDIADDMRAG